jgi:TPR repeat protein
MRRRAAIDSGARVVGRLLCGATLGLGVLALGACGSTSAPRPGRAPAASRSAEEVAVIAERAPPAPSAALPAVRPPCASDDLVGCTNGCSDGRDEDCVSLGTMLLDGAIVSTDPPRALALFRAACTKGSARGCLRLADAYHEGRVEDAAEETRLYQEACEAGANLGCLGAGRAYLEGRGVAVDPADAAALFGRVCQRGNAAACVELARLFVRGEGVEHDPARAFELFSKACKLGSDEGCLYASRTGEILPPRE